MIELKKQLEQAVYELYPDYSGAIILDSKKDRPDFEYSTAVVFGIAKQLQKPVLEVAQALSEYLQKALGEKITVFRADQAPAFINFRINSTYWKEILEKLLENRIEWDKPCQNKRVLVEFISANPTGPLTLANGRGGYSGDALANVFDYAGAHVEREYYVNDTGNQVVELGRSVIAEQKGEEIEGGYKGEYVQDLAKIIKAEDPKEAGEKAADYILNRWIKPTIEKMGIQFTRYFSEKQLVENKVVANTHDTLDRHELVYQKEGALWLKTTEFGDDKDRVIRRSDGTYTYFMTDIAYHWDKLQRGYDVILTMVGADHFSEARALEMVIRRVLAPLARWRGAFVHPVLQFVRLVENGQEVKMSKRAGTFVTLDEVLDRVPSDVARFFFVWHAYTNRMDFDLTLAQKQSDENPVYYIQYAYVRAKHILEKAERKDVPIYEVSLNSEEKELLLQLLAFESVVEDIVTTYEVHKLAHYAIELAKLFHAFYTKNPVLKAEHTVMPQRLALTQITFQRIQEVLGLIGVSKPERMVAETPTG